MLVLLVLEVLAAGALGTGWKSVRICGPHIGSAREVGPKEKGGSATRNPMNCKVDYVDFAKLEGLSCFAYVSLLLRVVERPVWYGWHSLELLPLETSIFLSSLCFAS